LFQRHSSEQRMDTSTPPDTSLSTHHPHDSIETSGTDIATPVLTGTHLATITSHGRGGCGVISGGETLHRRGRTSRRGTGRGETRGSTDSVSVESHGSDRRGRGGRRGRGRGCGIDISTSPFENSLGTWGKKTICILTCLQAYSRSRRSTAKYHDSIRAFFYTDEVWDLLITETNCYAGENLSTSHHAQKWKNVTVQQMKAFVGILIMMGILQFPRLEMYWELDDDILEFQH